LAFFSMTAVVGDRPWTWTIEELAIESFYPADGVNCRGPVGWP